MFQKKIFNISNKSYLAIFVSKIFKRTQETADDDNDEKKVLPICLTSSERIEHTSITDASRLFLLLRTNVDSPPFWTMDVDVLVGYVCDLTA